MEESFKPRSCLSLIELEHYVRGTISDDQILDIENHLLDCPLCSDAIEGLEPDIAARKDISDSLAGLVQQMEQNKHSHNKTASAIPLQWTWLNRAAAILVLGAIGYAIWGYYNQSLPERLADQYFILPPNKYAAMRSAPPEPQTLDTGLATAIAHYHAGQHQKSLPYFAGYLAQTPDDHDARMMYTIALFETDRLNQAEKQLRYVQQSSEGNTEIVQWYLALIYLAQYEQEKAMPLLKTLSEQSPVYQLQASELIRKLEKHSPD
jgi:Flp pilus assembly protein TadD